ncbi:A24 family peptidase [Phenylobacterium soli]|uniref:Peptidase A24 n=1 Tax=Phenylobacterium soli TaxID=2170551 RepID=A0A328AT74_9CAUL|nr:prepilin peptidase [Phenylobacterium soli]RAK56138.1 peptidase A24 [Phenylobacterium soli]
MTPIDPPAVLIGSLLTAVLAWAAITDIRDRRIPNRAVLAVLLLFVAWAAVGRAALGSSLAAGAIALVAGFLLVQFALMGAGDAKLFAALALFAGMTGLPGLAFATAMAGGVLAVATLASRPTRTLTVLQMRGAGDLGRGIPYGVAIAAGACVMLWGGLLGISPHV